MRRRRRVTGRFYIFLLILLLIVFLIVRPHLNFGSKEAVIMTGNTQYTQMMNCVIIRDETVATSESAARVEYIATENTLLNAGDTVAYVYTAGYSESLLQKLETTRASIQEYHKNTILQNMREDTKLTKLYDEENTRLASIQSWRQVETASESGVVSFYMDGYEADLTPDSLSSLTPSDVRTVLAGGQLSNASTKSSGIYRIVNQDQWYVALVADASSWYPVVGQEYYLQMQGFEDLSFTASVTSVQKESGTLLAIFEINDPIGPLIYQRTGKAMLSTTISGLSVTSKAIYEQNGQMGVWLYDVPGGTFIPVEVLSDDGSNALIQPLAEGALDVGQRVLIK